MHQSNVNTSQGLWIFRSLDLDETEEDVKTAPGSLFFVHMHNAAAAARFVKFYNGPAANVVVGTTPPVMTFRLAAGGTETFESPIGLHFDTAICVAATTGVADSDVGAPAANDVIVNVGYA